MRFSGVIQRARADETVFNGFILLMPLEPVSLHEHPQFFRKAALAVMLLLLGNVSAYLLDPGVRNRKDAVAPTPTEFAGQEVVLVCPMRRSSLEQMHHLLNGQPRRQVHQHMDVIGVHVVDSHVDAFLGCVLVQVLGDSCSGGLGQEGPALQRAPNRM